MDFSPVKENNQQMNQSLSIDESFERNSNYPYSMSSAVNMLKKMEDKISDPKEKIVYFNTLSAYADNRIGDALNIIR